VGTLQVGSAPFYCNRLLQIIEPLWINHCLSCLFLPPRILASEWGREAATAARKDFNFATNGA
jgi:hypothetical protein